MADSLVEQLLLIILDTKKYYIKVPAYYLAIWQMGSYSFYVSDKDLSKRNKARLHNFNIAMNQLDKYYLLPSNTIFFNKLIARKK
jgi:hypothetical protein